MSDDRRIAVEVGGRHFELDPDDVHDLAIRLDFDGPQPNAFHLEPASASAVDAGDFVGDTRRGGAANCRDLRLNPHGNGTHTECVGHIVDEPVAIGDLAKRPLLPAVVLSARPTRLCESNEAYGGIAEDDDRVVTRASLETAFAAIDSPTSFATAVVVRTLPNAPEKKHRAWSGRNPPYPTADAIGWLLERSAEHLVVDLPSVDREDDGGSLPNHHLFFDVAAGQTTLDGKEPSPNTVTEMAYVDDEVDDGVYLLDLQIPPFALDAAPSRPLLFGIFECGVG